MGSYFKNIKAILFDSGNVLNYPSSGHWFITPDFFKLVDRNKFECLSEKPIKRAFQKSIKYLEGKPYVLTVEKEFEYFIEFYSIFSKELPSLELGREQIVEIARDAVYNDDKYYFPEDVHDVISELSKHYKLAVVSDAWPSLDRVYRNAGLRDYFSSFVISSVIGAAKPDKLIYQKALHELDVEPEEALFIDNNTVNLKGANKLGINTLLMNEKKENIPKTGYLYISSLRELNELLSGRNLYFGGGWN